MKKIELRKITYNSRLSEETNAYAAQVWVDGVHVCDVSNHGTGGPDEQHPAKGKTSADVTALDAYCKANLPKRPYDFGEGHKGEFETDLESVCGQQVDDYIISRDLKRNLSGKVLFQKPGQQGIYQISLKKIPAQQHKQFFEIVKKKNGVERLLNEMPFEEALSIYKAAA